MFVRTKMQSIFVFSTHVAMALFPKGTPIFSESGVSARTSSLTTDGRYPLLCSPQMLQGSVRTFLPPLNNGKRLSNLLELYLLYKINKIKSNIKINLALNYKMRKNYHFVIPARFAIASRLVSDESERVARRAKAGIQI